MLFQQPEEIPKPEPAPPEQQFGEYSLEYFIEDNFWFLLGILFILVVVLGYSWYVRRKKRQNQD